MFRAGKIADLIKRHLRHFAAPRSCYTIDSVLGNKATTQKRATRALGEASEDKALPPSRRMESSFPLGEADRPASLSWDFEKSASPLQHRKLSSRMEDRHMS